MLASAWKESGMSEPQERTPQPTDEARETGADAGHDVRHAGGGRTEGETSVDDSLGSQDNVH
jgi:hypothetical protein